MSLRGIMRFGLQPCKQNLLCKRIIFREFSHLRPVITINNIYNKNNNKSINNIKHLHSKQFYSTSSINNNTNNNNNNKSTTTSIKKENDNNNGNDNLLLDENSPQYLNESERNARIEAEMNKKQKRDKFTIGQNVMIFIGSFMVFGYMAIDIGMEIYSRMYGPKVYSDTVPISNRNRIMALPHGWELNNKTCQSLDEHYHDILDQAEREEILFAPDHVYVKLCRHVLDRLVSANDEIKEYKWEVNVIGDLNPNAYVLANGKIVVNVGMILLLSNEDELAAVLAHEVAHVLARHYAESLISYHNGLEVLAAKVTGREIEHIINYHQNVKFEEEADHIGLMLMSNACYNPVKAPHIWYKFEQAQKELKENGKREKFYERLMESLKQTHPAHSDRFISVNKLLPKALNIHVSNECVRKPNACYVIPEFWEHMATIKDARYASFKETTLQSD